MIGPSRKVDVPKSEGGVWWDWLNRLTMSVLMAVRPTVNPPRPKDPARDERQRLREELEAAAMSAAAGPWLHFSIGKWLRGLVTNRHRVDR
jgi:hypothetical protein